MSGHIQWRKDIKRPWCFVRFPYQGVMWEATRYRGKRIYDEETAWKLLHQMQGEVESGTFNPLKYTRGETNVISFLYEWLDECSGNWTPGTLALYKSYIRNHIEPFFKLKPYQINEVRKKQYQELKSFLEKNKVKPEYVKKVVDCLRAAMYYAFDCEIVSAPPPRMKKESYQIPEHQIKVITTEAQDKVINAIEPEHRAIYWFLKYHPKFRPANAMMLMIHDYDPADDCFTIRRGISGGQEVEHTKTKRVLVQPCHPEFKPILTDLVRSRAYPFSPYLFTCKESRHKQKRYTKEILNSRWNQAAKTLGIDIDLYHGTRHTTITRYANELTPEQTKILAGHTSVQTTMTYYGKVSLETERALMTGKVVPLKKKVEK